MKQAVEFLTKELKEAKTTKHTVELELQKLQLSYQDIQAQAAKFEKKYRQADERAKSLNE